MVHEIFPISFTDAGAVEALTKERTGPSIRPRNTLTSECRRCIHSRASGTFPDSKVTAVHNAPSDYPSGKEGDVLTVEFTVLGIPVSVSTAARRSGTARPFPSRSRQRLRTRRIITGTRSSAMAAREASAVGARTAGASHGRSPRAR